MQIYLRCKRLLTISLLLCKLLSYLIPLNFAISFLAFKFRFCINNSVEDNEENKEEGLCESTTLLKYKDAY